MIGPGKYEDLCTESREKAGAVAALLIVIEGKDGNGFSCQTKEPLLLAVLPALLRKVADDIEADLQKGKL